jgi:sirohydrochlorin ferrochelatase
MRHGLTAETVVQNLEDAEDYKAFEATIIADYGAETAVARELVLRLASLLWRLRRATAIETDLFTTGAGSSVEHGVGLSETGRCVLVPDSVRVDGLQNWALEEANDAPARRTRVLNNAFSRLAKLDGGVFERLNRHEAALWRQAIQIIWVLKPIRLR